jgi:hypothetical protein
MVANYTNLPPPIYGIYRISYNRIIICRIIVYIGESEEAVGCYRLESFSDQSK